MTNSLTSLFEIKKERILNIYCTAGYPEIDSLPVIMRSLQTAGADIIEVGIPYSDPVADGPVIQQSSMKALENGMTLSLLFDQLNTVKREINIPVIMMGYFNNILQYGVEKFCNDAAAVGIAGVIFPDLPAYEYENFYKETFEKFGISFIFLITPETSPKRIKKADQLSSGFLYAVSSSSVTGKHNNFSEKTEYFERLANMKLNNPALIGFGISNAADFNIACNYAPGAIIGSAFIKSLAESPDIAVATADFVKNVKG